MSSHIRAVLTVALLLLAGKCENLRSEWELPERTRLDVKDDIGGIFVGFVLGPILFGLSFVVIWYNEKRAAINKDRIIKVKKLLAETQAQLKSQSQASSATPQISEQNIKQKLVHHSNPANLIYLSGPVTVNIPAQDPAAKLKVQNALNIMRSVEVAEYRTVSKKKRDPPQLGWYSYHLSTANGASNDAGRWLLKPEVFTAKEAIIQGYKMNEKEMKKLMANSGVTPTAEMADAIKETANKPDAKYIIEGEYIYFPSVEGNRNAHGSLRVKFAAYKPDSLSIICSHIDKNLEPFRIDLYVNKGQRDTLCCEDQSCCCMCNALGEAMKPISQVDFVMEGRHTEEEVIRQQISTNNTITNILRLVAYFTMAFGIYLFFSPIVEILGYIPLVGGFLSGVAGTVIMIAALIICIPLFLVTMSLAWLVYHPRIGIIFVVVSLLITTLIIVLDQVYSQDQG